jgi:lipoprotein-anchoring transpeptidase ErfK/SrfK
MLSEFKNIFNKNKKKEDSINSEQAEERNENQDEEINKNNEKFDNLEKKENNQKEKISWKEKLQEISTNPELYKQIIKTGANTAASICGVKAFYSVPEYLYQRFQVRGMYSKNSEGNTMDGLSGAVRDLIVSTNEYKDKESFHENLKTFHKKLSLTKEGGQKGSAQRQELAKILKEFRHNKDKGDNFDFESIYAKMQNVLDNYTSTKITGIAALKESMNSALTFSGAFGFRGVVYTVLEAWERKNNLDKKNKQNSNYEKVSWWKDVIKGGIVETFESARFKQDDNISKKQKIFKAIKSYGHIARFLGIGATAAFEPDNYSEGIDNMLNMMSGNLSIQDMAENVRDKADILNLQEEKDNDSLNAKEILINQKSQINREIDINENSLTEYELQQLKQFKLADNLIVNEQVLDVLNSDIDVENKERLLTNPDLIDFYLNSGLPMETLNKVIADGSISEVEGLIVYNDELSIDEKNELLNANITSADEVNDFIEAKNSIETTVDKGSNFTSTLRKSLESANSETKIKFINKVINETDFEINDFNNNYSDEDLDRAINYLSTQSGNMPENKVSDLVYEGDAIKINAKTGDWQIIRNTEHNINIAKEVDENQEINDLERTQEEEITRLEPKKGRLYDSEEKEGLTLKDNGTQDESIVEEIADNQELSDTDREQEEEITRLEPKKGRLYDSKEKESLTLKDESTQDENIAEQIDRTVENPEISKLEQKESGLLDLNEKEGKGISYRNYEAYTDKDIDVSYEKDFLIIGNAVIPKTFSNYVFSDNPDNYQEIIAKWLELSEHEKEWYYNFNDNLDLYKNTSDLGLKNSILKDLFQNEELNFDRNTEDNILEAEYKGNSIIANNEGIIINNGDLLDFNIKNLKNIQDIILIERSEIVEQIDRLEVEHIESENKEILKELNTKVEKFFNINTKSVNENIDFLKQDFSKSIETSIDVDLNDQSYFRNFLTEKIESGEIKTPENGHIVIVDRSESGQTMNLFHYDKDKNMLSLIGADIISTANPDKYEGAETPLGIHYINRIGKAEVWGQAYGDPGHEIYDISVESGPAFHPTNEEKLLGSRASHGCIRMTDQLNDYLDKHNILSVGSPIIVVEKAGSKLNYVKK